MAAEPRATKWAGLRQSKAALSIEQILAPLIVALAEQAHQVAIRVQTERARRARQTHAGFLRRAAALPVVARMAASYQIFPGSFAGAGARHHVVERQLV